MPIIIHTITCALAHVVSEKNLLINKVWADEKPNLFYSELITDGTHPYLYENPSIANHISGTNIIDACRQLLKAISHLYYSVPIESRFVINGINIEFLRWAKLNVPVSIRATFDVNAVKHAEAPRKCYTEIIYHQEGHLIARANSSFVTFSKKLEDKLMAKQYAQPPLENILSTQETI